MLGLAPRLGNFHTSAACFQLNPDCLSKPLLSYMQDLDVRLHMQSSNAAWLTLLLIQIQERAVLKSLQ